MAEPKPTSATPASITIERKLIVIIPPRPWVRQGGMRSKTIASGRRPLTALGMALRRGTTKGGNLDWCGIVAKRTRDEYAPSTTWLKIKNRGCTQMEVQGELFYLKSR